MLLLLLLLSGVCPCCSQFAVEYEHRASVKLDRMDVINAFVDNIPTVLPLLPPPGACRC